MDARFSIIAGFCLAIFVGGCGEARYRLEGKAPDGTEVVMLLDAAAQDSARLIRERYHQEMGDLQKNTQIALDSLQTGSVSLNRPLAQARLQYKNARKRYREAFSRLSEFTSFGGNPIFSNDDLAVKPNTLLSEIADRFYEGKAFSLETEGEIRRYIREQLVPLEKTVNRARTRVNSLQRSQKGSARAQGQVEADFQAQRAGLLDRSNQAILAGLDKRKLLETSVDSTGAFVFSDLSVGRYHLYVPEPLPQAWLVPFEMQGHTWQELGRGNKTQLLIELVE